MENSTEQKRLLWIEDEGNALLATLKLYIEFNGSYELTLVENASNAELLLLNEKFDLVIFDIMIPPGSGKFWTEHSNSNFFQHGLTLLERTIQKLKRDNTKYVISTVVKWDDIKDKILKIDVTFDEKKQFINKADIIFPEDFIKSLINI